MAVCERRYPPRRQGPLVHKHLDRSWSRRENVTYAQRQKQGSQFWKLGESKRHRILHSREGRSGRIGNPGGSLEATRRSFNKDFLLALADDFKRHGAAAIEKVRKQQPAAY